MQLNLVIAYNLRPYMGSKDKLNTNLDKLTKIFKSVKQNSSSLKFLKIRQYFHNKSKLNPAKLIKNHLPIKSNISNSFMRKNFMIVEKKNPQ